MELDAISSLAWLSQINYPPVSLCVCCNYARCGLVLHNNLASLSPFAPSISAVPARYYLSQTGRHEYGIAKQLSTRKCFSLQFPSTRQPYLSVPK